MTLVRTSLVLASAAVVVLHAGSSLWAGEEPKAERVCINRRDINAIKTLDERHAFAKLSAGRFYLLTLDKSCQGFDKARRVALSEGAGRVCSDGLTLVSFETPLVGPMRCRIEAIDAVADESAARDLVAERAGPR
jgi:hypothetical protein